MRPDDATLDLHQRAVEAATAVRARHWPEGTVPVDADVLAARMGVEVVLGRPAGDAAVTAVRDERGARVVLAASLHPAVRSSLLLRALGHLSRPAPAATDGVTDEFTRVFASSLRVLQDALDALRREGLSWREVDQRLAVPPGTALATWRIHAALRVREATARIGVTSPPSDWW